MKPILPLIAALSLSGCASLPIAAGCSTAFRAGSTAQELIPILVRDWHIPAEKAAQWADTIAKGQAGVALFCSLVGQ